MGNLEKALNHSEYMISCDPIRAKGISISAEDLEDMLEGPVRDILQDETGHRQAEALLLRLADTAFAVQLVAGICRRPTSFEPWRIGEAVATLVVMRLHDCTFPWPPSRDARNPAASLPGADLVGFRIFESVQTMAFGEVKTSSQLQYPPSVVYGHRGLTDQVKTLVSNSQVRNKLVLYITNRASGTHWESTFKEAVDSYLRDPANVSVFGVLIRDTRPNILDLQSRAEALKTTCSASGSLDLYAIYLPEGIIAQLPSIVSKKYKECTHAT